MTRPFLTVITRCYKRPVMLEKNIESLKAQMDKDYEQIFIVDDKGRGVAWANSELKNHRDEINGEYVLILDDDDMLVNREAIKLLKAAAKDKPHVIVFRAKHQWLGVLPDKWVWKQTPKIGHIGSCDFIVKADWWKQFIPAFDRKIAGDYAFLSEIWKHGPTVEWVDYLLAEVQRISFGGKE